MLPPWVWLLHFRVETRHVHAATPPGEGGGSKAQGEGSPHRSEAEAAEGRSAQAKRGRLGIPLVAARSGQRPLAHGLSTVRDRDAGPSRGGRCGRERPAEEGGGGPERAGAREDSLPPSSRGIHSAQSGFLWSQCDCVGVQIAAPFNLELNSKDRSANDF